MAMGIRRAREDSTVFSVELVNNGADGPCRKQVLSECLFFFGYYSVNTIVMSSVPSNVAAHATATSAPDHPVWFHGKHGKQVTTLPWLFTPKGALFGPIYGIYVG